MKTRTMILCALFAALTAVGAFFKIPFALAAISLQFLFTAMAGVLLGAGYGALSQAVYVLIGLVGVPIFALGGGFSYIFQPTFGFLLGLIPCAYVIGKLAKRPLTFWRTALSMLAGLAVLYAIGVPYMALIANGYLGKGLTFWQVIRRGMLIYLPGDLLKIVLGSLTLRRHHAPHARHVRPAAEKIRLTPCCHKSRQKSMRPKKKPQRLTFCVPWTILKIRRVLPANGQFPYELLKEVTVICGRLGGYFFLLLT